MADLNISDFERSWMNAWNMDENAVAQTRQAAGGLTLDQYLASMGIDTRYSNPEDVNLAVSSYYNNPERSARWASKQSAYTGADPNAPAGLDSDYVPPDAQDYRVAMEAGRSSSRKAEGIPQAYLDRESMYQGLSNMFANPNAQSYEDQLSNLLGISYSQATNQGLGRSATDLSKMLQQSAGQLGQQTREGALSSGLNKVATQRLESRAEQDYLKNAEDQIKLADLQEKQAAQQLALQGIGGQYGRQIENALGLAQQKSADQKAKESLYLDQMQTLLGVSDERRRMDQMLEQQKRQQNAQLAGAGINAAAAAGSSLVDYFGRNK